MNKLTSLLTAAFVCTASIGAAATLSNGSLNGSTGTQVLPTGWFEVSPSPDTNDQFFAGTGGYFVSPDNSSDGGSWVGFGRSGSINEIFGQTITDFVIGQSYDLSWEAGNFGIAGFESFNNANSIAVFLDGTQVGVGAAIDVSSAWTDQSITFTPTATSQVLSFGLQNNVVSYLQIDGISLSVSNAAPVPVPAGLPLLIGGVASLAWLKRKRRG